MRQNIWKKVLGQSHSLIWERNCLVNGKYTNRMQFFSKWIKLLLLLLFGLLCCSFIVFIVTPPVASWDRKIRSADQIFDLEIVIRSTDRIFDLEIVIPSADRIFDLEILIRSADRIQFIWYFSFKMKKHLKIKFSGPFGLRYKSIEVKHNLTSKVISHDQMN